MSFWGECTSLFHYWSRKEFKSEDNEEMKCVSPCYIFSTFPYKKGYDQAEVLCPRWEYQTTPLPNHKSSILQDQASPKLIEWVNNYKNPL